MTDNEQDEATFEKILGAAEEIKDMARIRPADAPAMLEQARHLIELAEQIKSDWQRRQTIETGFRVTNVGAADALIGDAMANTERGGGATEFRVFPAAPAR
jgi:hypothetical protein